MAYQQDCTLSGGLIIRLLLGWIASATILFGPWIAMVIYFPAMPMWIHVTYWLVIVTYLLAAWSCDPAPDMTELGYNPFSFDDDNNREMLKWALILMPGKLVGWTLRRTWSLFRR